MSNVIHFISSPLPVNDLITICLSEIVFMVQTSQQSDITAFDRVGADSDWPINTSRRHQGDPLSLGLSATLILDPGFNFSLQ